MIYRIRNLFKKIFFQMRLGLCSPSQIADLYRKYYGITIGNNVRFTGKPRWGSEPYLIEIGDDVTITQNVVFHTHDGGVAIFRKKIPNLNVFGKIKIGNNVFIGSNVIFLPGVTVGYNVVIGAGSIVTKDIPDNVVAAGIPARVIKTIDEYFNDIEKKAIVVNVSNPMQRKEEILRKLDSL